MSFARTFVLNISCIDRKGIVAAVANNITAQDCNILESGQHFDAETGMFFMRVEMAPAQGLTVEAFKENFKPVASAYNFDWDVFDSQVKPRVMIMVSKLGHCLNDLLYRAAIGNLPMDLVCVVSNHETWKKRVEDEGIDFHHLPVNKDNKEEQETALLDLVDRYQVDLVVLARYMQILSDELSKKLMGRVINIHHSFLPSFKGAKPYHQAHKRGVKLIGATAHYVTADLDEGPIIEQDVRRVNHKYSAPELVSMGQDVESRVLARAVKSHLEHRILLNDDRTVIFE
ncbi:formyltetrahydrofolate deformylase [Terasakiella pusilla]|jgi:formyltetrahydrofolate deformylase|uniref:formyltetrahydrofolate deformylase n=1 Tax=Terasakiella pusilla TaxID=64973 RepID=UPI000491496F|nr:formyltetrahydrofolate deformylase [Terasakiella pusilla]